MYVLSVIFHPPPPSSWYHPVPQVLLLNQLLQYASELTCKVVTVMLGEPVRPVELPEHDDEVAALPEHDDEVAALPEHDDEVAALPEQLPDELA